MKYFCSALLGDDKDSQLEKKSKNDHKNNNTKYNKNSQCLPKKSKHIIRKLDFLSLQSKKRNSNNKNLYIKLIKGENSSFDFDTKNSILEIIDYPITKNNGIFETKQNSIISYTNNHPSEIKGDDDSDIEFSEKDFEINTKKNIIIPHIKIKKNVINKKKIKIISKSPDIRIRKSANSEIIKNLNINLYYKNKCNLDSDSKIYNKHLLNNSNIIFNTCKKHQSKQKSIKVNTNKYSSNLFFKNEDKNSNIKYNNIKYNYHSIFEILNETKKNIKEESKKSPKKLKTDKKSISIYFLKENKIIKKENEYFRTSPKCTKIIKLKNPFQNLINNQNLAERSKKYQKKRSLDIEKNLFKNNKNNNSSNQKNIKINKNGINETFDNNNYKRLYFRVSNLRKKISFVDHV